MKEENPKCNFFHFLISEYAYFEFDIKNDALMEASEICI